MIPQDWPHPRTLTAGDLRALLEDVPDSLPVHVLVDVALGGSGDNVTSPNQYDVELIAPVYDAERVGAHHGHWVELRVDWRQAG